MRGDDFTGTERFEIKRRLGAGGMGVVYQAYDHERDTKVALKMLRHVNPSSIYRFKREFRALTDVSHPNLVQLGELMSTGDRWFFTMELVEGVDFLRYVWKSAAPVTARPEVEMAATQPLEQEGGKPSIQIDLGRLRSTLKQLAKGGCALHDAGKLHRDIKPSNVLVSGVGRLVLLDFGLVGDLGSEFQQTVEEDVMGTPAYMSPEQAGGRTVTPASDWYGVGVMLFEALTGRVPFDGTPLEVLREKQECDPARPSALVEGVPDDLDALCSDLLQRTPDDRPSGRELLQRLGVASDTQKTPISVTFAPGAASAFVGRANEVGQLEEAFAASRESSVTALVRGTSGMGKTSLVYRFLDEVRDKGDAVILTGRCYEREFVPYKALDSLVDSLARYLRRLPYSQVEDLLPPGTRALCRLFPALLRVDAVAGISAPVHTTSDPHDIRWQAAGALKGVLRNIGQRSPLVLYIDDLQWGDIDSASLLLDLLRPPDPPPMLWVASFRSEEQTASPLLREIMGAIERPGIATRVVDVRVGPLGESDAHDLALSLIGRDDPTAMARARLIAEESEGSPFFVGELVRYLDTTVAPQETPEPVTLDDVLQRRFGQLPEEAARLLEVICLVGRPIERELAIKAARLETGDTVTLALLQSQNLVRSRGSRASDLVEPYHDRVRETVTADVAKDRLREIHMAVARLLEGMSDPDPEQLAQHFSAADDSQRAFQYALAAAKKAGEALAFDRAADLYRLAIKLSPAEELPKHRQRLADVLALGGRGAEAAEEYLAISDGLEPIEAAELHRLAADNLLRSGRIVEGLEVLQKVIRYLGLRIPATRRRAVFALMIQRARIAMRGYKFKPRTEAEIPARDLGRLDTLYAASTSIGMIDHIRGAAVQTRHLVQSLKYGEERRVCRALAIEVVFRASFGGRNLRKAEKLNRTVEMMSRRIGDPYLIGVAAMARGAVRFFSEQLRLAAAAFGEAERIFSTECVGADWERLTAAYFYCTIKILLGDLTDMTKYAGRFMEEAERRRNLYAQTLFRSYPSVWILLSQDRPEEALEKVDSALEAWPTDDYYMSHNFLTINRAMVLLYLGRQDEALALLNEKWRPFHQSMIARLPMIRAEFGIFLTSAGLAQKDSDAVGRGLQTFKGYRTAAGRGLTAGARAFLATRDGNRDRGHELLLESIQYFEQAEFRIYANAYRYRLGELTGGSEGERLRKEACKFMSRQGVRNPERVFSIYVPPFTES